jgi:hypothetical protein
MDAVVQIHPNPSPSGVDNDSRLVTLRGWRGL